MNRIREALKGAEQERAAARAGHAKSAAVVEPPPVEPANGAETSPPADTRAGGIPIPKRCFSFASRRTRGAQNNFALSARDSTR